jgi:hypothetical protein
MRKRADEFSGDSLQRLCPKAMGVSPWYGVYVVVPFLPRSKTIRAREKELKTQLQKIGG